MNNFELISFTRAAELAAEGLGIKVIVAATISGRTARYMSLRRPAAPILGLTDRETTLRRMGLYRGVLPVLAPGFKSHDDLIAAAGEAARAHGLAGPGDLLLLVSGVPLGQSGITNNLRLHKL